MKLISKNALARFSGEAYSIGSMSDLLGKNPYHTGNFIRLTNKTNLGLMGLVEGIGNVFVEEKNLNRLDPVDHFSYTWDIEVNQVPLVTLTRPVESDPGNSIFTIYISDAQLRSFDVYALENTQQLYVHSDPVRISDGEYAVDVQYWANTPLDYTNQLRQNATLRFAGVKFPEFATGGSVKHQYNHERMINYLTKIRTEQKYSGDFKSQEELYFIKDKDAKNLTSGQDKAMIYRMGSIEKQVTDDFLMKAATELTIGRSTMDEATGRPMLQVNGSEDIISGDGIVAQFERHANWIDYPSNGFSTAHLDTAIEWISEKTGKSEGNHLVFAVNRQLSREKNRVLKQSLGAFQSADATYFWTRDLAAVHSAVGSSGVKRQKLPNEIAVGATFNTYIYAGNVVTFIEDPALTHHYQNGYGILLDAGIYEDSKGSKVPSVYVKTLKNRAMLKNYTNGIGGQDGRSSGTVSHSGDHSSLTITGWRGACVTNPYGAVIFAENK